MWDILQGGATVAVVALTEDDDQVVLARQYRPGPGRVLLELPGGNSREAARRFFTTGGQCPDNITWRPKGQRSAV